MKNEKIMNLGLKEMGEISISNIQLHSGLIFA